MTRTSWKVGALLFVLPLQALLVAQPPPAPATAGPGSPRQDAMTVEACLSGSTLEVIKDDPTNLTGARTLRLKGSRSMRQRMREFDNQHVRVTGVIAVTPATAQPDRIEGHTKRKVGKTTVYVAAAGEQRKSGSVDLIPEYELTVDDLQSMSPTCRAGE